MEFAEKTEASQLKGPELDRALTDLSLEKGLKPSTVRDFLVTDLERAQGLSEVDKWVPASLMVAHLVSLATVTAVGGDLPTLGELPPAIHELLQAVHNLTVNAANSPAVRDHLPFLFLEAAGGYGALKTLPKWLHLRNEREEARMRQTEVRQKVEAGEMRFNMAVGHTAAFVGAGDWLASRLQEIKPQDQVMQYAHLKIDSQVWQLMQKLGIQGEVFESLDRGDFTKAGEVLILPVKEEDMFLPGEDGHDISLDEIESLVDVLDAYCESRGVERKKVIIVGRKNLRETYITRTAADKFETKFSTLEERVDLIRRKRGDSSVEVVDPTEIVVKKIIELSEGQNIALTGILASDKRYGERFFEALKEAGYEPKNKGGEVRVLYNITDVPTEVQAGKNDIAVILDASKKQTLLKRGVLDENIIVVPEEIMKVLSQKVEES